MQNVTLAVKGNTLTITVDLSKRLGPSKTGKTVLVASSQGNQAVPNFPEVKFGLNVYTTVQS